MQVVNHTFEKQYAPQNRFSEASCIFYLQSKQNFLKSASRNAFFKVIVSKRRFSACTAALCIHYNDLECEVLKTQLKRAK